MASIKWKINHKLFPELNPAALDLLVSEFKSGKGEIKKDSPRRTVKKIEYQGKVFYIKHIKIIGWDTTLKYLFLRGKIFTEWRIMNRFFELGIPAAYPVAIGINRKFGILKEAFLITQSLGEVITLHEFYRQKIKTESERIPFLKQLVAYLRFLHQKGILHNDFHIENIVVGVEKPESLSFYLIDLYKARIKRSLNETQKLKNLAQFIFSLRSANFPFADQEKIIRLYYAEEGINESKLNSITDFIFSRVKKLQEERFLSWSKKSFRSGKFFTLVRDKNKFLIFRRSVFSPELVWEVINQHKNFTHHIRGIIHPPEKSLSPAILKSSRKALVTKVELEGKSLVVKEGRSDTSLFPFRFFIARLRNRRAWVNSNKLALKKVPTPLTLALLEEKKWMMARSSFLITEYLTESIPLRYYIRVFREPNNYSFPRKRKFITFLANFVRTLHQEGIYHGDLKSDNFLIREKEGDNWECFIVDTDRVKFGEKVPLSCRIKNLVQLNATISQWISPSDRMKFFREYSKDQAWSRQERKKIYHRILKLSRARNTEQYEVSFFKKPSYFLDNRPLKILHINTEMTWRGGEQQTVYLLEGLNRRGQIAHLICQPRSAIFSRVKQKNIPVFPLRMRGEFGLIAAFKIAQKIKKEKYDIIHSHTSHGHSLMMLASLFLRKKPIRIVTRRVDFSIFRNNFCGLNIYKYIWGADHIIAVAQKVKEILIRDGVPARKISVVHSGTDMERFQGLKSEYLKKEFSLPPQAKILGNIGYLVGHKGQKYLIQAMVKVVKEFPQVHLLIVGKGELEKKLKSLVQKLGLNSYITFTGFREDVGALLNLFDLLVVSSTGEGLTATIVDALALEVPVVTTNAGGIPEIITSGETGIIVPPADSEALAQGIIWALTHYEQAKEMAMRGKMIVWEKFSADAMVEGNLRVYRQLLREKGSYYD